MESVLTFTRGKMVLTKSFPNDARSLNYFSFNRLGVGDPGMCNIIYTYVTYVFADCVSHTFSAHKYPQYNTDQQPQGEMIRKSYKSPPADWDH